MCNSIPNLSTACRGSIVEVAKITSVSMKTNQYSVTRSSGTGKCANRPQCFIRNLISVVLKKYIYINIYRLLYIVYKTKKLL